MEPDFQTLLFAFSLTLFAGLSTGIGSGIAFFARRTNTRFLSVSLGFSAGVMVYVSFVEIFFKSREVLSHQMSYASAYGLTVLSFFGGMAFIALIDHLIPSYENPHEIRNVEELAEKPAGVANSGHLMRMGLFTALAIAIHNFPEGIATFTAALTEPSIGVAIAVAIAIHNIPEGIAVSVPVFYATGSRKKAFWHSFLSGLAEPFGALIGYLLLLPILTPVVFGVLFAAVAGIMVFISIDELLPAAHKYGKHHYSVYGFVAGLAVMAGSLLLFV